MGNAIGNKRLILEREDTDYVWTFEAVIQPINSAANVRTPSFIDVVETPPATIDISPNLPGAIATATTHQAFQAVQHQSTTNLAPTSAPREINLAPVIFAALMIGIASFHIGGMWGYYQGSINKQVECKQ